MLISKIVWIGCRITPWMPTLYLSWLPNSLVLVQRMPLLGLIDLSPFNFPSQTLVIYRNSAFPPNNTPPGNGTLLQQALWVGYFSHLISFWLPLNCDIVKWGSLLVLNHGWHTPGCKPLKCVFLLPSDGSSLFRPQFKCHFIKEPSLHTYYITSNPLSAATLTSAFKCEHCLRYVCAFVFSYKNSSSVKASLNNFSNKVKRLKKDKNALPLYF